LEITAREVGVIPRAKQNNQAQASQDTWGNQQQPANAGGWGNGPESEPPF